MHICTDECNTPYQFHSPAHKFLKQLFIITNYSYSVTAPLPVHISDGNMPLDAAIKASRLLAIISAILALNFSTA